MNVSMIYLNLITEAMMLYAGSNQEKSITLSDKNAIVIYENGSEIIWERQFVVGYSLMMKPEDFPVSLDKKKKRR